MDLQEPSVSIVVKAVHVNPSNLPLKIGISIRDVSNHILHAREIAFDPSTAHLGHMDMHIPNTWQSVRFMIWAGDNDGAEYLGETQLDNGDLDLCDGCEIHHRLQLLRREKSNAMHLMGADVSTSKSGEFYLDVVVKQSDASEITVHKCEPKDKNSFQLRFPQRELSCRTKRAIESFRLSSSLYEGNIPGLLNFLDAVIDGCIDHGVGREALAKAYIMLQLSNQYASYCFQEVKRSTNRLEKTKAKYDVYYRKLVSHETHLRKRLDQLKNELAYVDESANALQIHIKAAI